MKTSQPQLPTMPPDFSKPITVRGSELAQAIAEAQAQGFHAHRMKVLPEVIYELQFFRLAGTAEAECPPEKSKKTLKPDICARQTYIPDGFYKPTEN